jgi:sulfotransferase
MITVRQRTEHWMGAEQLVGAAYNILRDAAQRGHGHLMHRVDFDDLTERPEETLLLIHQWLEQPVFKYDFNLIEQKIVEHDEWHGFSPGSLHTIRSRVAPVAKDARDVLGAALSRELQNFDYDFLP